MRKMNTTDLFSACRLVTRSGIREELRPVIANAAENGLDMANTGIEGMLKVIEMLTEKKCERLFYEFLARPFECEPEVIECWDLKTLFENLQKLGKENDVPFLLKTLSGLMKEN